MIDEFPSWGVLRQSIHSMLLQSRIVNLIGLPGSGRTTLLERVLDDWTSAGYSVVVVGGKSSTPETFRAAALEKLAIQQPWLVVVDDFDRLLNGSGGGAWNDKLNGHCVNVNPGEKSPAVILVSDSRFSLLDLARRSLIADAITDTIAPPQLSVDDLVRSGWGSEDVAREALHKYGSFPGLLADAKSGAPISSALESAMLAVVPGVSGPLAQRLRQVSRRTGVRSQPHVLDDHLAPLLFREDGRVQCAAHFIDAGYARLVEGADQFWPRDLLESARRFASRLFLSQEAIWLDRYIGQTPRQLVKFLDLVGEMRGEFDLRILSEAASVGAIAAVNKTFVTTEFARLAASGFKVRWQTLHQNDLRTSHARQLLFPRTPGIYHLPPVDRLLDTAAVGNEVDAYLTKFGDWESAESLWSRSSSWL